MTRFAWFGPILYCFAMLIGLLPMALLRRLGALFGAAAYGLESRETRIARRNLARAREKNLHLRSGSLYLLDCRQGESPI